jgi:hypothetical protein
MRHANIGQSRIIDPLGTTMAGAGTAADDYCRHFDSVAAQVRERLPVLKNRRFAPPQLL